jgi:flagellar biosynthesis protein FliQ
LIFEHKTRRKRMRDKAIIMKQEIRAISNYRSLIFSKYYLSLFLGITTIYLGYLRYALSPLYILILLYIIPIILTTMFKDNADKSNNRYIRQLFDEPVFILDNLKHKYRYSKTVCIVNSISYFIANLFIGLWQYDYATTNINNTILSFTPIIILTTGLLLRAICYLVYYIKIPFDLHHNRV